MNLTVFWSETKMNPLSLLLATTGLGPFFLSDIEAFVNFHVIAKFCWTGSKSDCLTQPFFSMYNKTICCPAVMTITARLVHHQKLNPAQFFGSAAVSHVSPRSDTRTPPTALLGVTRWVPR